MTAFFLFIATLFFFTPLAYIYLRLSGKIGPENKEGAFWFGLILWIICLSIGWKFIELAMEVSKKLAC